MTGMAGDTDCWHEPVLLNEVLTYMEPAPGKTYIDCTAGCASMSVALLEATAPGGRILSIDGDPSVRPKLDERLSRYGSRSVRLTANFSQLGKIAVENGFAQVDGILFDLGLRSDMVDNPARGFSFLRSGPLDMRMGPEIQETAYDLVNSLTESELARIIREMDEKWAKRIARAIVAARRKGPVATTTELAKIVERAIPRRHHPRRIHPATKTFLALRVAVNREKESLAEALDASLGLLNTGGVLCVISYSSFEDRILREFVGRTRERWQRLTGKAVRPGEAEIKRNPRSRSARLRAYRKVA